MKNLSRRQFIKTLGAGATLSAGAMLAGAPGILKASTHKQVLVVGGGFAGATAAKFLSSWSSDVDVTLIEPKAQYYSPILSNLVLNGQMNLSQLAFNYNTLAAKYGINVVQASVESIDADAYTVSLSNGNTLNYDRLILAPGIRFQSVSGLDSSLIPHAWQSGAGITQLRNQLAAMPNDGTFVMTIPAAPYRCPPGPYERACVVADYLQRNKPGAQIIVLDANADIIVEKEIFQHAFNNTYGSLLTYHSGVSVQSVDSAERQIVTSGGTFDADVLNVIPPQEAGSLIHAAGLNNDSSGRWAAVNPLSYESTTAPGIHIIGDSQGTGQPKAGHIANAEAKVCADAVIRLLSGQQPYAAPVTNSACYSPISSDTASWLAAIFSYNSTSGQMELVSGSLGASNAATRSNYRAMFDWTNNLFVDTFA